MREVRRTDRILDDIVAQELLRRGEYGFLSIVNIDGGGYCFLFSKGKNY